MTAEEKEMKEWIEQRRKGSDLMSKLLLRNEELQKENAELRNSILEKNGTILFLKQQIEKMKNDQKTAFIKGMRHFAKAMKKYDQTEGSWTDYFEHAVDTVLTRELADE